MRFVKGHGTQNDFLLLPDLDGEIDLTPAAVRAVCDRRAGIGADGVLRVVRAAKHPESADLAADAKFFMDYRNADGSVAEMCGNGVRVFLRYLIAAGLVEQSAAVATRGGIRSARALGDGNVSVQMGLPRFLADRPIVTAASTSVAQLPPLEATALLVPNPHVVVELPDTDTLDALDLRAAPVVEAPLPDGQNVEFVVRRGPRHLAMRVHERGSGETRSCGTGICAAAVALARTDPEPVEGPTRWRVDVPGGTCEVAWGPDGELELLGPAVLVGEVDIDERWLAEQQIEHGR
ncbi:diaminopimelate epimerase [uncultured Jatrophihabitans sp.]|uniref:diaminopimelate epimerase n=1 Tax=uncultured Jatrophihabitans sp. TaxID=1610747 RepID=UPI0035C9ACAA